MKNFKENKYILQAENQAHHFLINTTTVKFTARLQKQF